jgi:hypothetical protein
MAVNESRSANADLQLGIRDGRFKSLTPSRGGDVDDSFDRIQASVLPKQYGVNDGYTVPAHAAGCSCGAC